jgi:phosphate-selective porin
MNMKKIFILSFVIAMALPVFVKAQGCMESSSEDGVSIIGFLQPQWNYEFNGEDDNGESLDMNSFMFNRARLGVTGKVPYDFSYYAMTEFSPTKGGPYLLDFFVTYHGLGPWANISVGQFKQPFGLELSTACHALHTIDRSMVVNELASPFRDMGVMISGGTDTLKFLGLKNKNIFSWNLALVNGTGQNNIDNNKYKDFVGRLAFSPFEFVSIGGSYRYGKQPNPAIDSISDERMRWGADITLKAYNFLIQGEYIFGDDKGSKLEGGGCGADPTVVQGTFQSSGFWVMAMYKTPWFFEPVVKYQCYDPDNEADFNKKSTLTVGLNYFFNDWTRLQVNYMYNTEESSSTDLANYHEIDNDMLMVQLQILIK